MTSPHWSLPVSTLMLMLMFNELSGLQFGHGLPKLLLRVHNNRSVPCDRLFDRLAPHQQETDTLVSSLDSEFVAAVAPHHRWAGHLMLRRRLGGCRLFSQNRARIRGIAKRAGACEDIGKGVPRRFDLEPLPLTWANRDVEVIRIGRHPFHRSPLSPELATDDTHTRAVIVGVLGNCTRGNVLVPRIGHLQR